MSGRRTSEYNSATGTTIGNNNHAYNAGASSKVSKKLKNDPHTEYEFTTLNCSSAGTEQNGSGDKQEN